MSEDNSGALRRGLNAFNRRDKAAWIAVCDPEVANIPSSKWPESAPTRGAEAIWDLFIEW